jgi:hypothetical protein
LGFAALNPTYATLRVAEIDGFPAEDMIEEARADAAGAAAFPAAGYTPKKRRCNAHQ